MFFVSKSAFMYCSLVQLSHQAQRIKVYFQPATLTTTNTQPLLAGLTTARPSSAWT